MDNKTLKKVRHWIVDNYGQEMVKLINDIAPVAFEYSEELKSLLSTYFDPSKELAQKISSCGSELYFKKFLYEMLNIQVEQTISEAGTKTPEELMDEAGYILYPECQTEADIQSFRHYYYRGGDPLPEYNGGKPETYEGEELCTFGGNRLRACRVWFAVKKNVDEIRREDFTNPQRQDEYGTSVISIQFLRENSILSIKNRYNHRVTNSDTTFGNNLDAIIPGLTEAFSRVYGVKEEKIEEFDKEFPLHYFYIDDFQKATNPLSKNGEDTEKFYKFNQCLNGIYYCDNNVIIKDGKVIEDKTTMPPEQVRLVDYFIFDFVNKTITTYDPTIKDSFIDTLQPIKNMQAQRGKIIITKDVKDENGEYEQVIIDVNDSNQITGISHKNLEEVGDRYLAYNTEIEKIDMPKLKKCGSYFLYTNLKLKELNLDNLEECGDYFISFNEIIKQVSFKKLRSCGAYFLGNNNDLTELIFENLEECGNFFINSNEKIKKVELSKLTKCGHCFLENTKYIETISLSSLEECGDCFFKNNISLTELYLPNLRVVGRCFLDLNKKLKKLFVPKLEKCGDAFLFENIELEEFYAPLLRIVGNCCFESNKCMKSLDLPNLEVCGRGFFYSNEEMVSANFPRLIDVKGAFMWENIKMSEFYAPLLIDIPRGFFDSNPKLYKKISQCVVKGKPIDIKIKRAKKSNNDRNKKTGFSSLVEKIVNKVLKKSKTTDNIDDNNNNVEIDNL